MRVEILYLERGIKMKLLLYILLGLSLTSCYRAYDTRAKIGVSIADNCLDEGYAIFKNGLLDNEDGPALVCNGQGTYWFRKGVLHRFDGPAVMLEYGIEEFWINGVQYSKMEFYKIREGLISCKNRKKLI